MADKNSCVLCGHVFLAADIKDSETYVCPYCGTEKTRYLDGDYAKKNYITNAYRYLNRGNLEKAAIECSDYLASYKNDQSAEFKSVDALVKCSLTSAYNSFITAGDNLTAVVLDETPASILKKPDISYIESNNKKIYDALVKLNAKENTAKIVQNSVMTISLDNEIEFKINELLSNIYGIINLDLYNEYVEANVYKNINDSKALVIDVSDSRVLEDSYVRSVYFRFIKKKKPVVFVVKGKQEFSHEYDSINKVSLNSRDFELDLKQAIKGKIVEASDIEADGSVVLSLSDSDTVIPTYINKIKSRAGYQSKVRKLTISSTGVFEIGEYALAKSILEELYVNAKCNLNIDKNAFSSCGVLKAVEFSNDKTSISIGAFENCTSLGSVLFNCDVTLIDEHAFQNTKVLDELDLTSVKLIKKNAFNKSGISKITISPATEIEGYAFNNLENNLIVEIKGDQSDLKLNQNSFPKNTKIKVYGKNLKGLYKELDKLGTYQVEFVK